MISRCRKSRRLLLLSLASSLVASATQTLAYLTAYETPKANYFRVGSLLPSLALVFAFVAVLLGIFAAILAAPRRTTSAHSLLAPAPAVFGFLGGAIAFTLSTELSGLTILIIVSLMIAALYHAATVTPTTPRLLPLTALCGFFTVIACVLVCGYYYFDNTLEMNAPLKTSLIMGLLCTMIYYTAELRILLGKPTPRRYLILATLAVAVNSLSAIPVSVAFLAGIFDRSTTAHGLPLLAETFKYPAYLAGALILLGASIGIAVRGLAFLKDCEEEDAAA